MKARRSATLIALAAGAGLLAAMPANAAAPGAPSAAELAFTAPVGTGSQTGCPNAPCGVQQVFTGNTDGTGIRQLTKYAANSWAPVWSPDGAWVAYRDYGTAPDGTAAPALAVVTADGSVHSALDTGASYAPSRNVSPPSWSPDSTQIAYDYFPGTATQVRVVGVNGSGQKTLAVGGDPQWSPNGTTIAFVGPGGVQTIDPTTGATTTIVSPAAWEAADPSGVNQCNSAGWPITTSFSQLAWSPDGSRLAFNGLESCTSPEGDGGAGDQWIATVAPDGSGLHLIIRFASNPTWSPDGSHLAVMQDPNVVVVGADGSNPTVAVRSSNTALFPLWAPNGQKLAYYSCQATGTAASGSPQASEVLTTVNPDGSSPTAVADLASCGGPTGTTWPMVSFGQGRALRYQGPLRTDTAVAVAASTWSSAPAVVIARDDTYPDALAAGPVAAKLGGPLLLVGPDFLPGAVCSEIEKLGARTAYIMGDTTAVSSTVAAELASCGITQTERLEGPTRFDTAAAAATFMGSKSVYITEGADPNPTRGWPDAVAVSALAAYQQDPILLTNTDSLPAATANALRSTGVTRATIVGGSDVVSDQVANQIASMGITVSRVQGSDRYGTSAAVADLAAGAGLSAQYVWLAIGNNWPDALSAGPAAARTGSELLLIDGASLANSAATSTWLQSHAGSVSGLRLVGGPDVLSPTDQEQALVLTGQ